MGVSYWTPTELNKSQASDLVEMWLKSTYDVTNEEAKELANEAVAEVCVDKSNFVVSSMTESKKEYIAHKAKIAILKSQQ